MKTTRDDRNTYGQKSKRMWFTSNNGDPGLGGGGAGRGGPGGAITPSLGPGGGVAGGGGGNRSDR